MKTHGHTTKTTSSPTYRSWHGMRQRCSNPRLPEYANYGGRGIKVCDRWSLFDNFLSDMGTRPDKHTIDRVDVNGDYTPENCSWSTRSEQQRNRRTNTLFTLHGRTQCMSAWAAELDIQPHTLYYRITKHGWDLEMALTTPAMNRGRRIKR